MRLYRVYRVHCTGTYAFQQTELIVPRWPHPRTIVFARGRTGDWSDAPIVALGAIWKSSEKLPPERTGGPDEHYEESTWQR